MIKYLLFKPLGPEDLPTLKELTTSGEAPLQERCGSQEEVEMSCGNPGAGAGAGAVAGVFWRGPAAARRGLPDGALGLKGGFGSPGL